MKTVKIIGIGFLILYLFILLLDFIFDNTFFNIITFFIGFFCILTKALRNL